MLFKTSGAYRVNEKSANSESQMDQKLSGKTMQKLWSPSRGSPLSSFGTERRKFPFHLLISPISSLARESINRKPNFKW